MAEKTVLKQTKNAFKFIGNVTRVDKEGAFKEAVAPKGKMQGHTYRSLRFGVKTSETNEMTVQMYDFEPKEVFLWSTEKKKKDKSYKGDRIPYEQWLEEKQQWADNGFAVLQTNIGLEKGEDGKLVRQGLPSYITSEKLFEGLDNGDTVVVEGEIRYSTWTNPEGKVIPQKTFTIRRLSKIKDVDFHDDKFEEITFFEQEMVFVDAVEEKKEKKVFVTGRTIDYKGGFHDSQFVVPYADADGNVDEGMKKLADAFRTKFKFGDLLKVFGDAVNRVITVEAEDDDSSEEEDFLLSLGGKAKPKHAQGYAVRNYVSEMQITGIEVWDKKMYKESDFVVDNLVDEKSQNKLDTEDFGGKSKKNTNPFDTNEDEIDEEDLPF